MRNEQNRKSSFTRRAVILGGAKLAVVSTLAGRLYYLQFSESGRYKTLSEENRVKLELIPPPRGLIVDRRGEPLATNAKNFRLLLLPDQLGGTDPRTLLATLEAITHLDEEVRADILALNPKRYTPPMMVAEHLSWEQLSQVEVRRDELPGVSVEVGQMRSYPLADRASHVLGYVGAVSKKDNPDTPLLRLPGFKIGKEGIEKTAEEVLQGRAGVREVEVNAHGHAIREVGRRESIPGETLPLTLDIRLQSYGAELFGEESGALVLMEIDTGHLLACVSTPAYDPNRFGKGIPRDYWKALNENTRHPLINKAIAGQYPPGSTFKMIVGLAGLAAGSVTPATNVFCPGHFMLGNHRFNCWKKEGHGTVNLERALMVSCDTYFYTVGQRTGIEQIAAMCRKFGLGAETGIEIPGEKTGIVPSPEWKRTRWKQPWQGGDTINVAIGQGYVLTTPLQLAVMTARLASGKNVTPTLSSRLHPDHAWDKLDVSAEHLRLIRQSMIGVANVPGGTAYAKRITNPDFAMAGKTGTSQVRKILVRGQDPRNMPREHRHHGLFVGFAPIQAPKYAAAVLVEHGGSGSGAAAPLARDILQRVQEIAREEQPTPTRGEKDS